MSHVTDIILITAVFDRPDGFIETFKNSLALSRVDDIAGGNKAMQCDVFIGAHGHVDPKDLVGRFNSLNFRYPESAQLLIKDEGWDQFKVYNGNKNNKV